MQISSNTTGMEAGLTVTTDKTGRDHCVIVVKGTFETDPHGTLRLATEQQPLAYTDEHYGAPENSCIRYACDFVPDKPYAEVIVVGHAIPPGGKPVPQLAVRLEVQGRAKDIMVFGERRWVRAAGSVVASKPVPFTNMPLTFDRAFGGTDDTRLCPVSPQGPSRRR